VNRCALERSTIGSSCWYPEPAKRGTKRRLRKDINWVVHPSEESMQLLEKGKVDAFMAFPPEPQVLRAKRVGHVIVNTAIDAPWSQYYCCMLTAHRDFVEKYPVATKRAARAILKAADLCAQQPERMARLLVRKGFS